VNSYGVSIWLAMGVAAVAGAVASVLLNRLIYANFRRRGMGPVGMVIVALSMSVIIGNAVLAVAGSGFFGYNFSSGASHHIAGMIFTTSQLIIIGIAAVSMVLVHALLARTRLGKAMRAVAADATLARSCGILVTRVVDIAWAVSGALAGIAGVVLFIDVISFDASTGDTFLVLIIAAAILGGVGRPYGAMLGALIIGISTEVLAAVVDPGYKNVFALGILVIFVLTRPQGVLSGVGRGRDVAG
jgi:branched-chain amino acid transport system permease protein/neutral amino acid transport system permease protein